MCNSPTDNVVTTPTTQKVKLYIKKRKNVSNDLDALLLTSILKDLQSTNTVSPQNHEEKDADIFCLNMVKEFKDLPPNKKRLAKLKVCELFCAMQENE